MKNKIMIGVTGIVMVGAIVGSYMVGSEMGQVQGMNKILSEQEEANSVAHTEWANFGGGYYIIGAEVVSIDNGVTTFELISGAQFANTGEFAQDAIYMLTMSDNGTPEWMNDDIICAIWEAK